MLVGVWFAVVLGDGGGIYGKMLPCGGGSLINIVSCNMCQIPYINSLFGLLSILQVYRRTIILLYDYR